MSTLSQLAPAPTILAQRAAELGDAPRFLIRDGEGWQPVSWRSFEDQVRRIAGFLLFKGVEPGDRVCVFADNSVAMAAAIIAIQRARAVMVPIYATSSVEQVRYVVEHAGARVIFCDSNSAHRCDAPLKPSLDESGELPLSAILELGAAHADAADAALARIGPDDIGLMLYTSGTSGPPKGVPLTHANVGSNGEDWLLANAPLLHDQAVDILWLPMSHIYGTGEMCMGNLLGWTTYMSSPAQVLDDIPAIRPTVFFSVPAYWEKLAQSAMAAPADERSARLAETTGGRLRFCLSGGAGLKREIKELFHQAGILIIEGYGLTECSPTLTLNRADDFRFDSVGKPLAKVELRLADDGEILARGPNVFAGYFRDEQATRDAFEDGWFKTGDIGRMTADGFLQIIDRKKDILVTAGGKNIAPTNIEQRFADHPLIQHLIVYGDARHFLVACVWPTAAGAELAPARLRDEIDAAIRRVNSELDRSETIKRFAIIDQPLSVELGHLTASLKLRRKQIYQAFQAQFDALYQAPDPMR
jgi:long-chain acyl-CoA synthetase